MLRFSAALFGALSIAAPAYAITPFPDGFRSEEIAANGTTLHVRVGGHGPGDVAHRERLNRRVEIAAPLGHAVGGIIGETVTARLRLEQQREGRVAANVDPLDRIHLHCNL